MIPNGILYGLLFGFRFLLLHLRHQFCGFVPDGILHDGLRRFGQSAQGVLHAGGVFFFCRLHVGLRFRGVLSAVKLRLGDVCLLGIVAPELVKFQVDLLIDLAFHAVLRALLYLIGIYDRGNDLLPDPLFDCIRQLADGLLHRGDTAAS